LLGLPRQPASLTQILTEMHEKFGEVHAPMLGPATHNKGAH
jgi:hypothetical protein